MSAQIALVGPSTSPGAPQLTPAAINAAVNTALATDATAAAAAVLAETNRATAAEAAGAAALAAETARATAAETLGILPATYADNLTAAGTVQGTALLLTRTVNTVTTCAAGAGVILTAGAAAEVVNRSLNPLLVYPETGVQIETLAANAAVTVNVGGSASFTPPISFVRRVR